MSDVMVLHAARKATVDAVRADWLLDRLPYARRLDLERRDAAARAASLLALELVLEAVTRLRGAPPDMSRLRFPAGHKPSFSDGPWFSVSHSRTRVAIAVSDRCDLGIDVEDRNGVADPAALDRWTAIEATLKAAGCGLRHSREVRLAGDLATGEVSGQVVHLRGIALAPDCVARLATLLPVAAVRVEEWSPSLACLANH
jgi:phosphopantetheinyl transferase